MAATIVTTKINQIIESGVTLDEITEALGNAWYGDETYFEVRNNTAYYAVQRMAAEAASKQTVEAAPAAPTATPAPTACTRTRPAATAPQAATARQIAYALRLGALDFVTHDDMAAMDRGQMSNLIEQLRGY